MSLGSLLKDASSRTMLPGVCVCYGGDETGVGQMAVDHVAPAWWGGPSFSDNALPVCWSCNCQRRRGS